ncbi:MAG: HD domain-containing protein [Cytophagales bacterium]|nr:HD domain-containing protein [Armatimonadota bacterium]
MKKGTYLSEIRQGAAFEKSVFALKDVRLRGDDSGSRRATLTLCDRTGACAAVRWNISEDEFAQLQAARLVTVTGVLKAGDSKYPSQIRIDTFVAHAEMPADSSPYLPPLPDDQAAIEARFHRLVRSVANAHLSQLLQNCFATEARWPEFRTAVAATTNHHAYRGGLLRHTVEVAELCREVCRVYPALRHDLLIAGALLHDCGKLFERNQEGRSGEFTALGVLEGHLVSGAFYVGAQAQHIPGFPTGLLQALRHLILSHHDRAEWGSPVAPALPEAVVLAKCDQISAQTTLYLEVATGAIPGLVSVRRGDHEICLADLGLDRLDLGGIPEDDRLKETVADALSLGDLTVTLLPLRGLVAAGDGERGSEALLETGERIATTRPPGGADYLTQVVGDSMIGAGIHEGDRAYVRCQEIPSPGDIVIAFVPGNGVVIKRFGTTAEGSFLFSENPDTDTYPPIPIAEGTRIQGVVTRVERDLTRR